jgi:hypothetical protein
LACDSEAESVNTNQTILSECGGYTNAGCSTKLARSLPATYKSASDDATALSPKTPASGSRSITRCLESACAMPHQRPQFPAFLDGLACLHLSNDVVDQRRDYTLISI